MIRQHGKMCIIKHVNILAALEMKEIMEIADEILEVHGIATGRKSEGVTRVIHKYSDGLNNLIGWNRKLEKEK